MTNFKSNTSNDKWYLPRSKLRPLKRAQLVSLSAASRGVFYLVFPSLAQKRKFTFASLASLGNKILSFGF